MKRIALVLCLGLLSLGAGKRAATGPQFGLFAADPASGLLSVDLTTGKLTQVSTDVSFANLVTSPTYDVGRRVTYLRGEPYGFPQGTFVGVDPYTGSVTGPLTPTYSAAIANPNLNTFQGGVSSPKHPGVIYMIGGPNSTVSDFYSVRIDLTGGAPIAWGEYVHNFERATTFLTAYDPTTEMIVVARTQLGPTGFFYVNPEDGSMTVAPYHNIGGLLISLAVEPTSGDLICVGAIPNYDRFIRVPKDGSAAIFIPSNGVGNDRLNFLPVIGATMP